MAECAIVLLLDDKTKTSPITEFFVIFKILASANMFLGGAGLIKLKLIFVTIEFDFGPRVKTVATWKVILTSEKIALLLILVAVLIKLSDTISSTFALSFSRVSIEKSRYILG